uniref:Uncharacterized protein n=1 Tax=Chromera velia CCMP2878 TaxID=1169474 RepID=A0A0G4HA93_9ALVE|mmetsp:Transcript_12094/g.23347  ORF Transcript_12094/g.23347 Transcript_12094/m.23347 type:complete len:335 (+) Transcript_12094:322-1326(+)|eukprot:Cvel_25466.t1-p1 / transcript=Cvel_25466.t1 / gene=Cvel_25466 / organism=Chromera_velia_CCMP2878 / gene_product=Retinol dehydrogenase 12, putative / transcript_product=Retinol dehydrogenase 12, putative / location=Cvel_scaffold2890:1435-2436(-) / protein_length=334 / sequence_SO=supercontig / SO=protein_coding / is_pseudo=false
MRQRPRPSEGEEGVQASTERRLAVVTGANTGIGYETALGLAGQGFDVVLACRNVEQGRQAAERIQSTLDLRGGSRVIASEFLDLSRLETVGTFRDRLVRTYGDCLSVLVNNAGINYGGPPTEDGFEPRWQVNYLGHFALTKALLPLLQKYTLKNKGSSGHTGQKARVVCLGSVMYRFGSTDWSATARAKGSQRSYGTSKLAMLVLAKELHRRYGETVTAVGVNPGFVNSDIWRFYPWLVQKLIAAVTLTTAQGSVCSVHAATSSDVVGGEYFSPYWVPDPAWDPCGVSAWVGTVFEAIGPFRGALLTPLLAKVCSEEVGESLWSISEHQISKKE